MEQKQKYIAPGVQTITIEPAQVIAGSAPELHTTGSKVDINYDALSKERDDNYYSDLDDVIW